MEATSQRRILLAVCGGIASYKAAELVRLLKKEGADVRVVMTEAAKAFVTPLTFQALSGNPACSDLLDTDEENAMGHINLARWADVMVVAPASANTIAKFACGMADNLVTTLYLAATCPIYVAPAMNQAMWHKPITQDNIARLKNWGVTLIEPRHGDQACGETGFGRMAEPKEICEALLSSANSTVLRGVKVLVNAGPTREYLDPVRFISNRSSGKMGYAIAQAAAQAGAEVTLVSGPTNLPCPAGVKTHPVETAAEMYQIVMESANECDIFIGSAAVADYSPNQVSGNKIKKTANEMVLTLQKTQDILAAVAKMERRIFSVGFAAETDNLENYAQTKLKQKGLDMIAANWVGKQQGGFDSDQNALEVFWNDGYTSIPLMNKTLLAKKLINLIAQKYHENN